MNKTCIVLLNIIFKNNMTKPQYMFAQNLVYGIACRITRLCHTSHWNMCILEGCICQHSFLGHTTLDNRISPSQLVRCRGWVAIYLYRGTWLYTRSEVCGANDPTLYREDVVISGCLRHTIHKAWYTCPYAARAHDDVIKWKHIPRYWPFVRGIHRPSVSSPHKGPELWCFLSFAPEYTVE